MQVTGAAAATSCLKSGL